MVLYIPIRTFTSALSFEVLPAGSYAVFSFPLSFETVSLLNSKTTEK